MLLRPLLVIILLCLFPAGFLAAQDEDQVDRFMTLLEGEKVVSPEDTLESRTLKLQQAREIADGRGEARLSRELGLTYLNLLHDYEKAIDLFLRALTLGDSLSLADEQPLTLAALARVFYIVGDYHKSAQFLEGALKLNQAERSINADAMILNALGKVNAALGRTDEALANYHQVLRYRNDIRKTLEADALFNLANLHTQRGEHEQALKYHREALALSRSMRDRHLEATSLNDIGVLYSLMSEEARSLANHMVALEIRRSLADKRGMAESLNNIGWLNLRQGDPRAALEKGLAALEHGREAQAQTQMLRTYDLLSNSYKSLGDFRSALNYKELTLAMQDFIHSEMNEQQLLERESRYVVEKKESEIQRLDAVRMDREREIEAQKRLRNILWLVVGLVVVTAGLLLILYLVKRRSARMLQVAKKAVQENNDRLQKLNQTKDKFFSIIGHDLKGPLHTLTSFSRLLIDHTEHLSKEEIRKLAGDLDKSVKNLLALLENLLEWSRSQTGNIDFTPEAVELGALLESNKNLLASQAASKKIALHTERFGHLVVMIHRQSINTVVRNLISNAIKFTPEGGEIRVGVKTTDGRLQIFVADTGVGMTEEVIRKLFRLDGKHSTPGTANEKGTGLGLILCREFVEKNGGLLEIQSAPQGGSVFTISFPEAVILHSSTETPVPVSL